MRESGRRAVAVVVEALRHDALGRPGREPEGPGPVGDLVAVRLAESRTRRFVVDGRVRPPEQRREPAVRVVEREDQRLRVRRDDAVDRIPVPDLTPAVDAVAQDLERGEDRRRVARCARVEAHARSHPEPPLEPVGADRPSR